MNIDIFLNSSVSNMISAVEKSKQLAEINSYTHFVEENLKGYVVPEETLLEIRYILMRRFKTKFSDVLSAEGRLAMEQTAKSLTECDRTSEIHDN